MSDFDLWAAELARSHRPRAVAVIAMWIGLIAGCWTLVVLLPLYAAGVLR